MSNSTTVTDLTTTLPTGDSTTDTPTQPPTTLTTATTPTTTQQQPTTTPTTTAQAPPPTTAEAPPPDTTRTFTAPSVPPTTQVFTSVVTQSQPGQTLPPSTVVITQVTTPTPSLDTSAPASDATTSSSAGLVGGNKGTDNDGGLSAGATIAIAVVIPVVVVAGLVFAGLFWWRRRKQKKTDEDERRKEMEAYGFNPNHDPTLPVVGGMGDSDVDGQSGYRGWGGTATSTTRKASTTLSSGVGANRSDNGGYGAPGSPNAGTDNSGEALMAGAAAGHSRKTTMDSETMGNLGPLGVTNGNAAGGGVQRGISNASSTYSMGNRSHASHDAPIPVNGGDNYYTDYNQAGPYDNPYGYGQEAVIRDNPARRNTRIERAPTFPNQGSSGIAQNF